MKNQAADIMAEHLFKFDHWNDLYRETTTAIHHLQITALVTEAIMVKPSPVKDAERDALAWLGGEMREQAKRLEDTLEAYEHTRTTVKCTARN